MPNLLLKPEFFGDPRITAFAKLAGTDIARARGWLLAIWFNSQTLKLTEASALELASWADWDLRRCRHSRYVEAMLTAGLLRPMSATTYTIVGNQWRIESNTNRSEIAKNAADAMHAKRKGQAARRMLGACDEHAEVHAPSMPCKGKGLENTSYSLEREIVQNSGTGQEPPRKPRKKPGPKPRPAPEALEPLLEVFRTHAPDLPFGGLNKSRTKGALEGLKKHPDLDWWRTAVSNWNASPWARREQIAATFILDDDRYEKAFADEYKRDFAASNRHLQAVPKPVAAKFVSFADKLRRAEGEDSGTEG